MPTRFGGPAVLVLATALTGGACVARPPAAPEPTPPTFSPTSTPSPSQTVDDLVRTGRPSATVVALATPTAAPILPPVAVAAQDFEVRVSTDSVQWTDAPLDLSAQLVYIGQAPMVTVYGAASGLVTLGFSESADVEDGMARAMYGSLEGECTPYTLERGVPIDLPLTKAVRWSGKDDPNAGFYQAWLADPQLHLPSGTWNVDVEGEVVVDGGGDCAWADGTIDPERQPVGLYGQARLLVTPFSPIPLSATGCPEEPNWDDGSQPQSLTIGNDVEAPLTMQFGWQARTSMSGGDIDYGAWHVQLPDAIVAVAAGDVVRVSIGPGFQLHGGSANRYAAAKFVVDNNIRVDAGKVLGHPTVNVTDGSSLELVAPQEEGSWVIQLQVGWITPCLISGGEVNFRIGTY